MATMNLLSSSSHIQSVPLIPSSSFSSRRAVSSLSLNLHSNPSFTFLSSTSFTHDTIKIKPKSLCRNVVVFALANLSDSQLIPCPSEFDGISGVFPAASGVYAVFDKNTDLQFIGISRNIASSVSNHLKSVPDLCSSVKIMDHDLTIDPGPRDHSVLHLQSNHRSSAVWKAGGGDAQRARRRDPNRVRFPPLHPRMIPILTALRFDGVARLTCIDIDWSLITALVERWRPETHTFHLPIGECTITLQDVSVLLGLRIDGSAVIGCTAIKEGWKTLIQHIFGELPDKKLVGGRLQLSWLTSIFPSLPDDASEEHLIRYTQSYLLQLIAGILFTDHSGGQVHCMYIPLIQDLDRCGTLSWGSAVLAFLFRELCKSCRIGTEENAGCILLLQLWAWTRLHTLAPICRRPSLTNPDIWGDLPGPYGLRWCAHLSFTDTGSHVVSTYRLSLDVLASSHFIWQPYTDDVLAELPEFCQEGSSMWCYKGPLICFYIVEPHFPDRCLRQFGMIQSIPSTPIYSSDLHSLDLKGKIDTDWRSMHHEHVSHWNSRHEHVFDADIGVGVVEGYEQWYTQITRRFHTRVGGTHSYMLDLLEHISLIAMGQRDGDILNIAMQGRQIIKDQLSSGVFQDFPIEDRRARETSLQVKLKPKRVGHKGGRGGVNAPRKYVDDGGGAHVDDVEGAHVEDDGGDHVVQQESDHAGHQEGVHMDDVRAIQLQADGGDHVVLEGGEHVEKGDLIVQSQSADLLLNSDLNVGQTLDSSDVVGAEHIENADSSPLLSHPTFKLISSSDSGFSSQPLEQPFVEADIHATPPLTNPTFDLLPPDEYLHLNTDVISSQLPHGEAEINHTLSRPASNVLTPPLQQPQQPQERMKLRPRNYEGQRCGTGGHKIIRPYKRRRLVKKYPD